MHRVLIYVGLLFVVIGIVGCSSGARTAEVATVTERPEAPTEDTTQAEAPPPSEVEMLAMPAGYDTVEARRFDRGKMWTFDNPPLDYFEEAYGLRPDSAWFEKARLGALRFASYCSASFVSPNGLVMTNHHCGRESVNEVSAPDEDLLDQGFYAASLEEERKVEDLFVDQLIAIEDVTDQIYAVAQTTGDDELRAGRRRNRATQIEERMTADAKAQDSTLYVEVISLYNGGRYSAYTFRRYEDVRLVMAPELRLGHFGGDADNFTYPRYALDVSFFRAYDEDGDPLATEHYFPWSTTGSKEGDAVFVIGNPGTTSRLSTVSQLEYERDHNIPQQLKAYRVRAALLKSYVDEHPEEADAYDLRNAYFSMSNSIKNLTGQLDGLHDPYLMARRIDAERDFLEDLVAVDSLQERYGGVVQDIRELQRSKEAMVKRISAFAFFGTDQLGSRILTRGLYGYYFNMLQRQGLPPDEMADIRESALAIQDWPAEVERQFIAQRLRELRSALGSDDPTVRRVLQGQSPDSVATRLVANSALLDSTKFANLLDEGYLSSGDASVEVAQALSPLFLRQLQQQQSVNDREQNLNAQLAQARFVLYGTTIPPDASFSPRIADGVVRGYEYNGTYAAPYTTFFGLYDHFHSYGDESEWALPERWLHPPTSFEHATPVNLVTTNDISGGNSGSPLLNRDLEVVGLIFDSNIEALPNEFIYRDEAARAIAVDARGILEALDDIYDADRVVLELTRGQLAQTEEEADTVLQTP